MSLRSFWYLGMSLVWPYLTLYSIALSVPVELCDLLRLILMWNYGFDKQSYM